MAVVKGVCQRCWLIVRAELETYHGIQEHGDKPAEGYRPPVWELEKHLFADGEFVSIGSAENAYGE